MTKAERIENLNRLSGTDVRKCMKCGKCSGRCPAFKEMDIKPHQFVTKLGKGQIEELLESKSIWNCLSCMACVERCPRGVAPAAVVEAVRDTVVRAQGKNGLKAEEIRIDYIGLNSLHLGVADMDPAKIKDLNEVVLRIAIRTLTKDEAYKIVPEVSPLQLNGPPGASFFGGRAKVQEVIGLWPTLIPRDALNLQSHILEIK